MLKLHKTRLEFMLFKNLLLRRWGRVEEVMGLKEGPVVVNTGWHMEGFSHYTVPLNQCHTVC